MRKILNKQFVLSVLTAAISVILLFMAVLFYSSAAPSGTAGKNITWTYDSGTKTLSFRGRGEMDDCVRVTVIGTTQNIVQITEPYIPWQSYLDEIKHIVIGNGITSVGKYAFNNCKELEDVVLPETLETIGEKAFCQCKYLANVEIGKSLKKIGDYAFYGCESLSAFDFPETLVSVGDSAFKECINLKKVLFTGNELVSIEDYAFLGCKKLSEVRLTPSVKNVGCKVFEDTAFIGDAAKYDNGFLYRENVLIRALENVSGNIKIREGTVCVAGYAFGNCDKIEDIAIPESVKMVGREAFSGCRSLAHIYYPKDVRLGGPVYGGCAELKSAGPEGSGCSIEFEWKEFIPSYAFNKCDYLEKLILPGYDSNYGVKCFDGLTSLKELILNDGITAIQDGLFQNLENLETVTLPEGVTIIGKSAFKSCYSLKNINIPSTVSVIDKEAFSSCSSLVTVDIPSSVEKIDYRAFSYCKSLEYVDVHEGLSLISENAFEQCTSLTYFNLPLSLKYISDHAFNSCSNLSDAFYAGTKEDWQKFGGKYFALYTIMDTVVKIHYENNCLHLFGDGNVIDAPTCKKVGHTEYKCERCDYVFSKVIKTTGHVYSEEYTMTKRPSVMYNGIEKTKCIYCTSTKSRIIPKLEGIAGDANGDESTDVKDILILRRVLAGLNDSDNINLVNSDIDGDEDITAKDILVIRKIVAGLI